MFDIEDTEVCLTISGVYRKKLKKSNIVVKQKHFFIEYFIQNIFTKNIFTYIPYFERDIFNRIEGQLNNVFSLLEILNKIITNLY